MDDLLSVASAHVTAIAASRWTGRMQLNYRQKTTCKHGPGKFSSTVDQSLMATNIHVVSILVIYIHMLPSVIQYVMCTEGCICQHLLVCSQLGSSTSFTAPALRLREPELRFGHAISSRWRAPRVLPGTEKKKELHYTPRVPMV